MREDRIKYADSLIDAVGQIEDKYIYEAQSYAPKKRLPAYVKGAIGLAASLLIVISAFVPLYLFSQVRGGANSSKGEHMTLQAQMYSALINSSAASFKELPEIDGAALVWQDQSDMGYRVVHISAAESKSILSARGKPVSNPENTGVKLWVLTEDGVYMTPELKKSNGNTDIKAFDYLPEVQITDAAAKTIISIVKEN